MGIEAVLQEHVVEVATTVGWFARKVQWEGRRNAPDWLFAKGGRVLFIEMKSPDEEARIAQAREHKKMREAGIEVHVCKSHLEAFAVLGLREAYELVG